MQFRTKSTAKGKFVELCYEIKTNMVLRNNRLFTNVLIMISIGIQCTKSQGTQCILLQETFVTSTPCASDDELSDSEEEMDADEVRPLKCSRP